MRRSLTGAAVGAHLAAARAGDSESAMRLEEFVTEAVALLQAQPDAKETLEEHDRQ